MLNFSARILGKNAPGIDWSSQLSRGWTFWWMSGRSSTRIRWTILQYLLQTECRQWIWNSSTRIVILTSRKEQYYQQLCQPLSDIGHSFRIGSSQTQSVRGRVKFCPLPWNDILSAIILQCRWPWRSSEPPSARSWEKSGFRRITGPGKTWPRFRPKSKCPIALLL